MWDTMNILYGWTVTHVAVVRPTKLDVDEAWLVHAVGRSHDDVLVENRPSAEPDVFVVQEKSLKRPDQTSNSWY